MPWGGVQGFGPKKTKEKKRKKKDNKGGSASLIPDNVRSSNICMFESPKERRERKG